MAASKKTVAAGVSVLVLGAFLAGYVPGRLQEARLSRELATAQDRNRVLSLQSNLAIVLIDVEESNFGIARERASAFFDELRDVVPTVSDQRLREQLQSVLGRRDEINSELTALRPEVAAKLRSIFKSLYGANP